MDALGGREMKKLVTFVNVLDEKRKPEDLTHIVLNTETNEVLYTDQISEIDLQKCYILMSVPGTNNDCQETLLNVVLQKKCECLKGLTKQAYCELQQMIDENELDEVND